MLAHLKIEIEKLYFVKVGVEGKRILVIGSQWPWLEFLLLARYLVDFLVQSRRLQTPRIDYIT